MKYIFWLIIFLAFVLRFFQLGKVPVSLYWDEVSLGYNAYSIAQTLRDEHGEFLPVARFIAFGDYKPPAYIYTDVPFVKVLGLSEFSTRLPSAIAGVLLVAVTYLLVKELFRRKALALLAALLLAVSPWALQFSRAAFEANLATLLSTLGIYLFVRKKLFLSAFTFVLAVYTFNSHRIFVPMILLALTLIFIKEIYTNRKKYFLYFLLMFVLVLPLIPHLLSREGRLRFNEVAWINDLAPIELSNSRTAYDGNSLWAKVIHNRRVTFAQSFLKHYTDHLRADFLFLSGDVNPRLSTGQTGEMYWLELPFLIWGVLYLIRKRDKSSALLLVWLLLAPVPAAMARETPHALRILNILPVPQILVALGLWQAFLVSRKFGIIVIVILTFAVFGYLSDYYLHYPNRSAMDWQYGYKEMVSYVREYENKYSCVNVTDTYGRPYIYFLFYDKVVGEKYWQTRQVSRDWYGFWSVHSFSKYFFDSQQKCVGKSMNIRAPLDAHGQGEKLLTTINSPTGKPVFLITESD